MQALAHHISHYELRLPEPFQALDFLREELAAEAAALEAAESAQIDSNTPTGVPVP
jgi:hypothetical protein